MAMEPASSNASEPDDGKIAGNVGRETRPSRDKDYADAARYQKELGELYQDVVNAFDDKTDQLTNLDRYWAIYNCELTVNQAYQGNSSLYIPIVRDAIEARVTRFKNMLFPENEQHVDVISYGGQDPWPLMAMLNHYVRKARMPEMAEQLLRNGEVEGHYSIYLDWSMTKRYVTRKKEMPVLHPETGMEIPGETYLDIEEEEIEDAYPSVEVIGAADVAVYPVTCDNIEEDAEFVAIARRMTKGSVKQMQRRGLFNKRAVEQLINTWPENPDANQQVDIDKNKVNAAGVKRKGKYCLVYEVWTRKFKIDGKHRWARIYYAGEKTVLSFRVNPNWNDLCPLISAAQSRVSGTFWGKSRVDAVEQIQYAANDAANMGMDSAQYSLLPIVMTNPTENPNYGSMILSLAAVWQTNPQSTQILQFPQLWQDAFAVVATAKSQIMESFGLNPAMMPQGAGAPKKPSQAQVAQETTVAIVNTSVEVTSLEDKIFTPYLKRSFEMDQQFRKGDLVVPIYGQLGIQMMMLTVPPFAWDDRYEFIWRGVQAMRSAQGTQQKIAGMNILRSMGPALPDGREIDITPIIEDLVEDVYGPRLGSRVIIDKRDQLSVDPDLENRIMMTGEPMPVHQLDDDQKHIQAHMAASEAGDPTGTIRIHIGLHIQQLQKKQAQAAQAGGLPGAPGGGAAPGMAGTPRPGAQPGQPRGGQNPPGVIHMDRLQDPSVMPRKAG